MNSAEITEAHPGCFVLSGNWTARTIADADLKLAPISDCHAPRVVVGQGLAFSNV